MQATATTLDHEQEHVPVNSRNKVVIASLIGTAIEFFDFYIYATAAVIVFPHIFFPQGDPTAATLQSLATFAIAFVARPIGSALFGHFGDRVGRKVTLVASLLTMGISTVIIGLLPGYATIGIFAPLLLALARFGQGLGGEWGGASFSYNVSSILGASVAPYIAAWLQSHYGLAAVGVYLASMAALTLIALLLIHETRHQSL
ncbi:MFS transporter [Salmonella enterica]|nr:MFS transporter [Salmonella enterica]